MSRPSQLRRTAADCVHLGCHQSNATMCCADSVQTADTRLPGTQIPDGKPANSYGFKDQCMNKEFTLGVIAETHEFYKALKSGARANDKELALA